MAQKKQTEGKETTAPVDGQAPVNEQAPLKSKASNAAPKKTPAAKPADATAEPAATTVAANTGDAAAKPAAPKKAPAPKAATNAAPKKAAPAKKTSVTKVYGEIQSSDNTYFIQKGSVPEGQLQLVPQKEKQELMSRIPSYNGQFVTVLGEFAAKKKTDKFPAFTIHSIASHDEIARKAYELSQDNPAAVEDNWFRAENEILQQK